MRIISAILAVIIASGVSAALAYPDKPIRVVVPFQPGGNVDITTRAFSSSFAELLGQPIVIENRGGAGGTVGSGYAAKAAPDGYTLLMGSTGTLTLAPAFFPKNPYNPVKDLAPIGLVSVVPVVLVVHPSVPATTVKELIALAKARPGELTVARAGLSLAGELFKLQTGVNMISVSYKGGGPAMTDLLGGHVDSMFDQLSSAASHITAGKVRALAVTTAKRSTLFPAIPTLEESGIKGANASTYLGMLAPAGTPRDIVEKLNGTLNRVLAMPATRKRFASFGAETWASSADEFAAQIRQDLERWGAVIRRAKLKTN